MKKILFLIIMTFVLCGCSKETIQEMENEINIDITKQIDGDKEIKNEVGVEVEKENNNKNKIIIGKDGTENIDLGNEGYYFEIDKETKELTYRIYHSSLFPNDFEKVTKEGTILIADEEIFNNIVLAYEKGVMDSKWANVYCSKLEDIRKILNDSIFKTKEEIGEEYWESLYGRDDLNRDDIVTYRENFNRVFEYMINEL